MLLPRDGGQQLTLPAVITATTLDELLAFLDVAFYPQPSPGFKARWGVLMGMTVLCVPFLLYLLTMRKSLTSSPPDPSYILLALLYAGQHLYSTTERPRWRSMWILRRVERPSGRFLVLKCAFSLSLHLFACLLLSFAPNPLQRKLIPPSLQPSRHVDYPGSLRFLRHRLPRCLLRRGREPCIASSVVCRSRNQRSATLHSGMVYQLCRLTGPLFSSPSYGIRNVDD